MTTKADQTDPEAGAEDEVLLNGHDDGDDEPSIEDLALEAGWTPKEKWKGDPGKHVGATEYMRRMAKSQKTLSKKLSEREEQLEAKEREFDDRLKRLEKTSTVAQKREIQKLRDEYEAKLEEAIESKDPAAIKKALKDRDEALEELEDDEKPEYSDDEFVESFKPIHSSVQKPFWSENAWLLGDDDEAEEAFAEVEEVIQAVVDGAVKGETVIIKRKGKDVEIPRPPTYEEMERAVAAAERFLSRKYKNRTAAAEPEEEDVAAIVDAEHEEEPAPKRQPVATKRIPVLGSGGRSSRPLLSSKLPPEAVKAADDDIKRGLFADREEWAKVYYEEQGIKV
jgi:hypothetical protein